MDPLTGALVAAGAAWLSIVAATVVPVPQRVVRRMRMAGAASLALVGLAAFGFPVPAFVPLLALAAGIGWAALAPREQVAGPSG